MRNDGIGMINDNYSVNIYYLKCFISLTCTEYVINNVTGMIDANYYYNYH